MRTNPVVSALSLVSLVSVPVAGQSAHDHTSKYAGLETREIKSLSADDLQQLREGQGWGLSLVAELNGVPGPRHVLDMSQELGLDQEQVARLTEVFDRMKREAIPLGEALIRLERELDVYFAAGRGDRQELEAMLDAIGEVRSSLRFVHLAAHLETPAILTPQQIAAYVRLRGYDSDGPCAAVPPGHDPRMWRQHNGCPEG